MHTKDWGLYGTRYDEECDVCGRVDEVDNDLGICEQCFRKREALNKRPESAVAPKLSALNRESLKDIAHMVREIEYPSDLPDALKPHHYYITDSGHSIMCVLKSMLSKAKETGNYFMCELPVPVKYVLEAGFEIVDGHIVVDAKYDSFIGLDVDEKYTEYDGARGSVDYFM
jgi:hypothetical protein